MRKVRHLISLGFGLATALVLAAPAAAVTNVAYTFDTSNSNLTLATSTGAGNSMTFGSSIGNSMAVYFTATAWNATVNSSGKYVISQATLAEYAGGLAVTSKYDDLSGTNAVKNCGVAQCDTHQMDNMGNTAGSSSIDFIKLDFTYAVTLAQIQQSAFTSFNSSLTSQNTNDDDFSYGKAASNAVSNGAVLSASAFTSIFSTSVSNDKNVNGGECSTTSWTSDGVKLSGCNDTRVLTTSANANSTTASTTWYIAASILNNYGGDGNPDSFKLSSITAYYSLPPVNVTPSVPEPSTWMTMIVGFGVSGTALRRARRQKAAAAAA